MTPLDVLGTIRQAGGRVVVLDGDLQVIAPPGTVSAEAAAVLREHKAALVGILPNAEREAIGWTETLSPAEAEIVVETASREWDRTVVETPVEDTTTSTVEAVVNSMIEADTDQEVEEIVPPPPCRQCNSLELWQDLTGGWHCQHCQADGLQRSERLVEQAARLRRQTPPINKEIHHGYTVNKRWTNRARPPRPVRQR